MTSCVMPRRTGARLARGTTKGPGYVHATVSLTRVASSKHVPPRTTVRSLGLFFTIVEGRISLVASSVEQISDNGSNTPGTFPRMLPCLCMTCCAVCPAIQTRRSTQSHASVPCTCVRGPVCARALYLPVRAFPVPARALHLAFGRHTELR